MVKVTLPKPSISDGIMTVEVKLYDGQKVGTLMSREFVTEDMSKAEGFGLIMLSDYAANNGIDRKEFVNSTGKPYFGR